MDLTIREILGPFGWMCILVGTWIWLHAERAALREEIQAVREDRDKIREDVAEEIGALGKKLVNHINDLGTRWAQEGPGNKRIGADLHGGDD